MPRPPRFRFLFSQSFYHIMTRGNNRNIVFKKEKDYYSFLDLIKKYKDKHPFNLYHYCLMPNHAHLLIQTKKALDFSTFMKKLNLSYFYYFKKRYNWIGHFWQGRFKSQSVGKDEYFIQCGKYIELNPVRASLVDNPREYRFSSYNHYAQGEKDKLLTDDFFYTALGNNAKERQINYQQLVIGQMIEKTYNKIIWGSNKQRYREKQKISRKLKKPKSLFKREASP